MIISVFKISKVSVLEEYNDNTLSLRYFMVILKKCYHLKGSAVEKWLLVCKGSLLVIA